MDGPGLRALLEKKMQESALTPANVADELSKRKEAWVSWPSARGWLQRILEGRQKKITAAQENACLDFLGLRSFSGLALREPGGEWREMTIPYFQALPEGDYDIQDSGGNASRITVRVSLGLKSIVLHATGKKRAASK